jgi:S-adenosylmethionine synthetase
MKQLAIATLLTVTAASLTACGPMPSSGSYVSPADQNRNAKHEVESAKWSAKVTCDTKEQCDRAFMAAKNYVIEHSHMRVQHSDEMSISTYRPSIHGNAMYSLSARMVPVSGGKYEIRPDGECVIDIPECLRPLAAKIRNFRTVVSAAIE